MGSLKLGVDVEDGVLPPPPPPGPTARQTEGSAASGSGMISLAELEAAVGLA